MESEVSDSRLRRSSRRVGGEAQPFDGVSIVEHLVDQTFAADAQPLVLDVELPDHPTADVDELSLIHI